MLYIAVCVGRGKGCDIHTQLYKKCNWETFETEIVGHVHLAVFRSDLYANMCLAHTKILS